MIAPHNILTHSVEIAVDDGTTMGGYVARPAGLGPFSGVVVAMELFGLSAHVRDVCEQLATFGFVALAPDLYHRTAPWVELAEDAAGRERGFQLLHQQTRSQVLGDVAAAVARLRADGSPSVGMVGLSVGGHVAYLAASELELPAVVVLSAAGYRPPTSRWAGPSRRWLARRASRGACSFLSGRRTRSSHRNTGVRSPMPCRRPTCTTRSSSTRAWRTDSSVTCVPPTTQRRLMTPGGESRNSSMPSSRSIRTTHSCVPNPRRPSTRATDGQLDVQARRQWVTARRRACRTLWPVDDEARPVPCSATAFGYRRSMHVRRLREAAVYERGGLRSHVLLDAGDFGSERLVVTWVEVPVGSAQRAHVHDESEQVYVIIRGRGTMTVGNEQTEVHEGDLVLVPPKTSHAIANEGDETLIYTSSTAPPQSMAELYRTGLS